MIVRVARWAWPVVFFIPLTLVAGRGCSIPGVDPTYHAILWLHENLPVLYLLAAGMAALAVFVRVVRARARARTLFALATTVPEPLARAFANEAARLGIGVPPVAYLDVAAPLCFALVGRRSSVVLSRGFIAGLDGDDLRMIARHELLHVKHRDPLRGFAWHLAFAALLLPAFSGLEHWLLARRELRTNLAAADAEVDPDRYVRLLVSRARKRRSLCTEGLGTRDAGRGLTWVLAAPAFVAVLLTSLALSHAWFLEHLSYLAYRHC